ncbi:WxL domain-containing protein [Carnobacterium maltaromaticum]|uniref:WxL domain-containing protein n=1 Tax=Carnobacterium maltaromaticum TaxID=2751 RepID=A0AAW9JUN6_CARML|nr:WxL domain-containing protein [Carnobacterium maltaromaticum]MDZ5759273.1 WxL domain-containing protein [Carnobacterium maltaromaticum]
MKMKNGLVSVGIVVMSGFILLAEQKAEAVEVNTAKSTAKFQLEVGDPTVPPEILDPEIGPSTGNKGLLTLDSVSGFTFETKKIGDETSAPIIATPTTGTKLGLQVTDNRGLDLGWNLKVSGTSFTEKIGQGPDTIELKGAVITIPEGSLTTKAGVDPLLTPVANKVSLTTTPATIMSASTIQGRSTWTNSFEGKGEKVTLAIPSGNKAGNYSSTITWSLEDAP